jgi:hypothetical protein
MAYHVSDPRGQGGFSPGRLVALFKDGVTEAEAKQIAEAAGAKVVHFYSSPKVTMANITCDIGSEIATRQTIQGNNKVMSVDREIKRILM